MWSDPEIPELTFRRATEHDSEFVFQLIKSTMSKYIRLTYGDWDDVKQRAEGKRHANYDAMRIISRQGEDIGLLTTEDKGDHLKVSQLYLLPQHQGQGIGTAILDDLKQQAVKKGIPLRTAVFHVNPAQKLYLRQGFEISTGLRRNFFCNINLSQVDTSLYL